MNQGYMYQEEADSVSQTLRRARRKMKRGEMKVVPLQDGQRPVTLRIATKAELAEMKKVSPRAPTQHTQRTIIKVGR